MSIFDSLTGAMTSLGLNKLFGAIGLGTSPLYDKYKDDPAGYVGTSMGIDAAERAANGLENGLRSQGGGIAGFLGNVVGNAGSWFRSHVAERYLGMAPSAWHKITDGDPAKTIGIGTALDTAVDALQRAMENRPQAPQSNHATVMPDHKPGWKYSWEEEDPSPGGTAQSHYGRGAASPPAYTAPATSTPNTDQEFKNALSDLDREVNAFRRERENAAMPQRREPGRPDTKNVQSDADNAQRRMEGELFTLRNRQQQQPSMPGEIHSRS